MSLFKIVYQSLRVFPFWVVLVDVLEESFQIERYCEIVWTILNEKKQVDELVGSSDSVRGFNLILIFV